MAGYHNHNVVIRDAVVRMPVPDAEVTDLATWNEALVLAAVNGRVKAAPRLLAVSKDPDFQVHGFVDGRRLDEVAPRGAELPEVLVDQLAVFLHELRGLSLDDLPPLPADWPADGDCAGFARKMQSITEHFYRSHRRSCADLWNALKFPPRPLERVDFSCFATRPFEFLHADLHRANMLVSSRDDLIVLDWEFASWGDPVYEIAAHVHKMGYQPWQAARILREWERGRPLRLLSTYQRDYSVYVAHERVKSALIDSARYARLVTGRNATDRHIEALVEDLTTKVSEAHEAWGSDTAPTADTVREALIKA